jgi:hypothetical protein
MSGFESITPLQASSAKSVTPNDTTDLDPKPCQLYIGGAGDVKVDMAKTGTAIVFAAASGFLPINVTRVYATGTTASGIVAIW